MAKISELTNAPEWLVLADTKDADVEINRYGRVIWKSGEFRGGEFLGGYFLGGEFLGGEFLGGEFRGGEFRGGYFRGGEFLGGYFLGGEFRGGYFRGGEFLGGEFRGGYFLGGEFRGGEFLGGEFLGGEFLGGEFLGGVMVPSCKWAYGITAEGKIKIGCKDKTVEEWDEWFAGTEEFTTKRSDPQFKRIVASFQAAKAYLAVVGTIVDKKPEAEYEPYGVEWETELMKHTKDELHTLFGISGDGITKKSQIQRIKAELIGKSKAV